MARNERLTPQECAELESPTADHSTRHDRDQVLRAARFEIHARPKVGPTLWRHRDGRIVTEQQALVEAGRK